MCFGGFYLGKTCNPQMECQSRRMKSAKSQSYGQTRRQAFSCCCPLQTKPTKCYSIGKNKRLPTPLCRMSNALRERKSTNFADCLTAMPTRNGGLSSKSKLIRVKNSNSIGTFWEYALESRL